MDPCARWRRHKDNAGVGWVQIGDPGRLGKNHREAHGADCTWGDVSKAKYWKGPWLYCVIDEAVTTKNDPWAGWDTARFVAFDDAGDNRVALRNPGTKRWLRVTPDGETQASARGDWNDGAKDWERFELHELAGGVGLRSASGRWLTIGASARFSSSETCAEIKVSRRRLFDGVAVSIPHRSTSRDAVVRTH